MNKYDIKYIIKKILIYSGVAIVLMFVKSCDVKAATILHGNLTQQVTRIWQTNNNTRLCDSWSSPAVCTLNVGTDTTLNGTFLFKANTYYGYQGYKYQFSGQIEGVGPQISFLNVSIMTNPGSEMGYCETKTSTNGTSVSFTTTCDIPGGLKGQDYANYLNFNLGTTVKLSQFTLNLKLDSDYFLYQDNSTEINNNVNNINNSVNEVNNSINNDNVNNQQSSDFFNNFGSTTNEGLQELIKKPIGIIDSFYNSCSPIEFDIPYFETTITLPCISSIQNDFTSVIFPIIRVIINGLLCYRILTRFIDSINKLKDPNDSDLEVVDL